MDFKTIAIKIGKLLTPPKEIEILAEFSYYYNLNKKFIDLKEYIYDLSNYLFCPCSLLIYKKNNNIENPLCLKDFEVLNLEDTELLSEKDLSDLLYVFIDSNKKCECEYEYDEKFKYNFSLSKRELIKLIENKIEKDDINQNYTNNLDNNIMKGKKKKKRNKTINDKIENEKSENLNNEIDIREKKELYTFETKDEKKENFIDTKIQTNEENEIKLENERNKLLVDKNDSFVINKTNQKIDKEKEIIKKENEILSVIENKGNTFKQTLSENAIIIDEKTNQIKEININNEEFKELENFYDVIINIKSIKDIEKGWEIKMTEKVKKIL